MVIEAFSCVSASLNEKTKLPAVVAERKYFTVNILGSFQSLIAFTSSSTRFAVVIALLLTLKYSEPF